MLCATLDLVHGFGGLGFSWSSNMPETMAQSPKIECRQYIESIIFGYLEVWGVRL